MTKEKALAAYARPTLENEALLLGEVAQIQDGINKLNKRIDCNTPGTAAYNNRVAEEQFLRTLNHLSRRILHCLNK